MAPHSNHKTEVACQDAQRQRTGILWQWRRQSNGGGGPQENRQLAQLSNLCKTSKISQIQYIFLTIKLVLLFKIQLNPACSIFQNFCVMHKVCLVVFNSQHSSSFCSRLATGHAFSEVIIMQQCEKAEKRPSGCYHHWFGQTKMEHACDQNANVVLFLLLLLYLHYLHSPTLQQKLPHLAHYQKQ